MKGFISKIERFEDGAASVFFKGCVHHCPWCCEAACQGAAAADRPGVREVEAADLVAELLTQPLQQLTLSGGEPLMQCDFATELCSLLKQQQEVFIILETCGDVPPPQIIPILPYIDLIRFDIPDSNDMTYAANCGADPEMIYGNLFNLSRLGFPIQLTVPLIPDISNNKQHMTNIAQILDEFGLHDVMLIPYVNCQEAWKAADFISPFHNIPDLSLDHAQNLWGYLAQQGMYSVSIGSIK